jgi:hypothetical protein
MTPEHYELAKQQIVHIVNHKHASDDIKLHCVHSWMFLGFKKKDIAAVYIGCLILMMWRRLLSSVAEAG